MYSLPDPDRRPKRRSSRPTTLPFAVMKQLAAALILLSLAGPLRAADPAAPAQPAIDAAKQFDDSVKPFLARYCAECHRGAEAPAGLDLERYHDFSALRERLDEDRSHWQKVVRQLKAEVMPPAESDQPPAAKRQATIEWLERGLLRVDCGLARDPGRVTIRRLNRTEYSNTVRDLLGWRDTHPDFKPADDFPADDIGYGFDHIGDVLSLPPILLEKYLAAAEQIADRAIYVYDPARTPKQHVEAANAEHEGGDEYGDSRWILFSSGEVIAKVKFDVAGEYILRGRAFGQQAGPETARMAFRIDGKDIQVVDVPSVESEPGTYEIPYRAKAGERLFGLAFVNDYYEPEAPESDRDRNLIIEYLEVQGPLGVPPGPLPESHRKIIFCHEHHDDLPPAERARCVQKILKRFAGHAWRRPATAEELERLASLVDLATADGESFERGIQLAVQAVLVSPHFLFRVERDAEPDNPRAIHPVSDYELATRLSYFLWSSLPDDELFRLAAKGKLRDQGELERQVRRMLADPRSRALVENFAGQWLQIRRLQTITPDPARFPQFDDALRGAMLRETEMFFGAIVQEDRSVLDLLNADFTFLNERLAKHYGVDGVQGEEFRRVSLPEGPRGGVLTQASVLTSTSNPTRTSPVKRGKWILEQLLGEPPPPPPPGVPELSEDEKVVLSGTLRQRMEQHRSNPACAACHRSMDPLGFGLENFDAIGAWRDSDGDFPVDASGTLPGGAVFQGPRELKKILLDQRDVFVRSLSEKLLTYALGRGLEYYDTCAVDDIRDTVIAADYRFSALVLAIVRSDPFQLRRGKGTGP